MDKYGVEIPNPPELKGCALINRHSTLFQTLCCYDASHFPSFKGVNDRFILTFILLILDA